ncbi:MAG TPA: hypothetical protein VIH33_06135 [Candidatus Limnocylindria bacterium]|jgi:hypothetical protein
MSVTAPGPRHLAPRPEDARPRLARLGHPDELTGMEPPVQRMANFLIAAERELSHVQSRYFAARRGGDPDAIAAAIARQEAAKREIGRLRVQLYAERRRELLQRGSSSAGDETAQRSLIQRLVGR